MLRSKLPWKKRKIEKLAKFLGMHAAEVREKQKLIHMIVEARKEKGLSQAALAKALGVSQGRIAQIESGIGTSRVTFDILLGVLSELGYDFRIHPKRGA